jgi:hypothetical protein
MRSQTVDRIQRHDIRRRPLRSLSGTGTLPLLLLTTAFFFLFFFPNINVLNDETILQNCDVT